MKEHVYLLTLLLPLAALVLVFGMKYRAEALQARAAAAADARWRELAEEALARQRDTETALTAMRGDLAKLTASITAIEAILKDV
ncbi:MAG: hypothetical protein MUE41_03760 [Gemmatimonadaceae bacterium]|nr:hypothetical protein [Gemmatimonadaceae bacterium]